jgi:predicted DNA-binding transcriptional regulator AlpA
MATANNTLEPLLNEHDVARITGLSVASVRRWRLLEKNCPCIRIGSSVRYVRSDVEDWLRSLPRRGGQQEKR